MPHSTGKNRKQDLQYPLEPVSKAPIIFKKFLHLICEIGNAALIDFATFEFSIADLKGTLMRICKFPYMFVFL